MKWEAGGGAVPALRLLVTRLRVDNDELEPDITSANLEVVREDRGSGPGQGLLRWNLTVVTDEPCTTRWVSVSSTSTWPVIGDFGDMASSFDPTEGAGTTSKVPGHSMVWTALNLIQKPGT